MNKENWNLELSTYIKEGNLSEIEKTKAWEIGRASCRERV